MKYVRIGGSRLVPSGLINSAELSIMVRMGGDLALGEVDSTGFLKAGEVAGAAEDRYLEYT